MRPLTGKVIGMIDDLIAEEEAEDEKAVALLTTIFAAFEREKLTETLVEVQHTNKGVEVLPARARPRL